MLEDINMDERYRILEELESIEETALSIIDQLATVKTVIQELHVAVAESHQEGV